MLDTEDAVSDGYEVCCTVSVHQCDQRLPIFEEKRLCPNNTMEETEEIRRNINELSICGVHWFLAPKVESVSSVYAVQAAA